MEKTNRRIFLKKAAMGSAAAGVGLTVGNIFPRRSAAEVPEFQRIYYRELGSTGYKASEIGFGAMNTRDPELIHAAIDAGINYLDTAHSYMKGVNEEIIGTVMKTKRNKVFLSTKLRQVKASEMPGMLELSLKRLNTDHVDLLLLHITESREQALNEDYIKTFSDLKKKGMTRFIGVATHKNQAEVIDAAISSKVWEAVLVGYNFTSPPEVGQAVERARKAGIATIAMKTMISIDGRNPLGAPPELSKGKLNAAQSALKWVLQNPYIDTIVPGMTSFEHLAQDLAVMGTKMTFFDRRTLTRYAEARLKGNCRGAAGCTGCQGQCPFGVEICDLNRCVGYAYGYGDLELARENYSHLPPSSRVERCGECDTCQVKCVNGLDLDNTIRNARELFG
ncbi:MAG: aldo/keto reductase [Candidatus Latescibacterota bacterium]